MKKCTEMNNSVRISNVKEILDSSKLYQSSIAVIPMCQAYNYIIIFRSSFFIRQRMRTNRAWNFHRQHMLPEITFNCNLASFFISMSRSTIALNGTPIIIIWRFRRYSAVKNENLNKKIFRVYHIRIIAKTNLVHTTWNRQIHQ